MIGYGDNAGSGFPDILNTWKNYGLEQPELEEDTIMNKVTLIMKFKAIEHIENSDIVKMSEVDKNERSFS